MTDDRIAGTVRNLGGKVQAGVGRVAGDTKTAAQGLANQAAGAVQETYGKTADAATEGAQSVKDAAIAGHDFLKSFIEDNPHTATLMALGIGMLIGYTSRRPPQRRYWCD